MMYSYLYLDLVWYALKAIADLNSDAITKAAGALSLESQISDRLISRQQDILVSQSQNLTIVAQLNDQEIEAWISIVAYVARQHQELLRRAVNLLEQATLQQTPVEQISLLSNYLKQFIKYERAINYFGSNLPQEELVQSACKLLVDLLFYSSENGFFLLEKTVMNYE